MTAAAPTTTLNDRIAECLRTLDAGGLAALYRADVLLDANVPEWRYQLQGLEAVVEQLREEWAPVAAAGYEVTASRALPMEDGVLVETEVCFHDDGEERRWRDVHIVRTDGEAVVEHTFYCTGIWDAATIARQAVEAPMVRAWRPAAAGLPPD